MFIIDNRRNLRVVAGTLAAFAVAAALTAANAAANGAVRLVGKPPGKAAVYVCR